MPGGRISSFWAGTCSIDALPEICSRRSATSGRLSRPTRHTPAPDGTHWDIRRVGGDELQDPFYRLDEQRAALEEEVECQRRALQVNSLSAIYQANLGCSLLAAGRYEEGLMHLRRARELSNARESTAEIALALILLGRHEEARSEFGRVAPGPGRDQLLVIIGDGEPARAAMSRLEADTSIQGRIRLAEVAALQGRIEDAFGHLDALAQATRPVEEGPGENDILRLIHGSPLHDLLRSEARWATLIYRFRQGVSGRG